MNSDSYVFSDSLIAQIPSFLKMIWWNMVCVCVLVAQSCPIPCNPMDCTPPGSSVHGILQARILENSSIPEGIAIFFSRGSSQPKDWIQVSHMAGRLFTVWATREAKNLIGLIKPVNPKGYQLFNIDWKDWCWSWNSNTLATRCKQSTHWKRRSCWETEGKRRGQQGWDGWRASLIQWTWTWANSRR